MPIRCVFSCFNCSSAMSCCVFWEGVSVPGAAWVPGEGVDEELAAPDAPGAVVAGASGFCDGLWVVTGLGAGLGAGVGDCCGEGASGNSAAATTSPSCDSK